MEQGVAGISSYLVFPLDCLLYHKKKKLFIPRKRVTNQPAVEKEEGRGKRAYPSVSQSHASERGVSRERAEPSCQVKLNALNRDRVYHTPLSQETCTFFMININQRNMLELFHGCTHFQNTNISRLSKSKVLSEISVHI